MKLTKDYASFLKGFILLIACCVYSVMGFSQEELKKKVYLDFTSKVIGDYTLFFETGLFPKQEQHYFSIAYQPELDIEWDDGLQSVVIDLFGRINSYDKNRSHWDIRELYYQYLGKNWEVSVGLKKVYWGVTEINHLVDVINQTDLVESFDGEQKLGQPMVQFTYSASWGTWDFFALPYHRERTFPGERGRLRFPLVVSDDVLYESDAEEFRPDFALRYSNSFGIADVGLSHFYGNAREPDFHFLTNTNGEPVALLPFYQIMHQTGLDIQLTTGSMLWKFEAIKRDTELDDFYAFDAGLEYTFGNVNGKGLDIGLLTEYLYDSRGENSPTGLDNDIFVGGRLGFNDINDTQILFGAALDMEQSGRLFSIEASRRFFDNYTFELEGRFFSNIGETEVSYPLRKDSFLKITLERFF